MLEQGNQLNKHLVRKQLIEMATETFIEIPMDFVPPSMQEPLVDGLISTSTIHSYLLLTKILYAVDNWETDNFKNRQIAFLVVTNEPTFEHLTGAVQHCFLHSIPSHQNFLCRKKVKKHSFYVVGRDLKKPTNPNKKNPTKTKAPKQQPFFFWERSL